MIVAPGALFPDSSDFKDASGKPIQYTVDFKYGKTDDLPSNLAKYLIDAGYAQETRIIVG